MPSILVTWKSWMKIVKKAMQHLKILQNTLKFQGFNICLGKVS